MAYEYDQNDELDLDSLTSEEKWDIKKKFVTQIEQDWSIWHDTYGPFRELKPSELGQDEIEAELDKVPENLIWVEVEYEQGSEVSPVEGLTLAVNGTAIMPGRGWNRSESASALIAAKPWSGDPWQFEPVYDYAQCECPFCATTNDECEICDGTGEWTSYDLDFKDE